MNHRISSDPQTAVSSGQSSGYIPAATLSSHTTLDTAVAPPLPSQLIDAAARAAIDHAVFLWQRCPPDGLPDLFGTARIFVISASWHTLRRLLSQNGNPRVLAPGIAVERACMPRRPLQSITVSGWENALRDALLSRADLPPAARLHAADSWRFVGVQRAAHEAAAAALRALNVRCYVSVEMD